MPKFVEELQAKMASFAGVVYCNDEDEVRLLQKCRQAAQAERYSVWRWSVTDGLVPVSDDIISALKDARLTDNDIDQKKAEWAKLISPAAFLTEAKNWTMGSSIVLAFDLFTMANRTGATPLCARLVKDITARQQTGAGGDNGICQLVINDQMEPDVETPLQRLTVELPSRREMDTTILGGIMDAERDNQNPEVVERAEQDRERILNSLMGMSALQASNAVMESLSRTGFIDADVIRSYKKQMVAAKGLTWMDTDEQDGFDSLGGLTPLKFWLKKRAMVMMNDDLRSQYGVGNPKGVICAGVPGGGKSFAARCLASYLGVPLLVLDVGATRGMFQGQSENDFAAALAVAASIPCVLLIDEAEKAFGGSTGQGTETDGGTGSRVLGTFLTWMQENESSVFVYMTANRPEQLPPELMRAGRTSGQFWFDVPTSSERLAIIDLMVNRYPKTVDIDTEEALQASDGCTGAEIEAAFEEAAISAMVEKRNVETADVVRELQTVSRIKDTFDESEELAKWRKAAQEANDVETSSSNTGAAKPQRRARRANINNGSSK